jgi:hypothetical protein
MRGRKHPLEIFRQTGKSFITMGEGSEPPPRPERVEPYARAGRGARIGEEPDPEPSDPPLEQETGPAPVAAAPPGKRTKRSIVMAKSGGAQRRAAARSRLVRQWVGAAAGLVLITGLAYAAKLWLFNGRGAPSDHGLHLQRDESIQEKWPDHTLPPGNAAGDAAGERPESAGQGGPSTANAKESGSKEPAAKGAAKAKEYWVVAASVKLSEQERSKNLSELRKVLFKNEEKTLHRGLDAEIERCGFRVQTVATNQKAGEFVLRVGCATTADDANLKSLLAKVIKLGGSFKNALIRDYPPATTR